MNDDKTSIGEWVVYTILISIITLIFYCAILGLAETQKHTVVCPCRCCDATESK